MFKEYFSFNNSVIMESRGSLIFDLFHTKDNVGYLKVIIVIVVVIVVCVIMSMIVHKIKEKI